MIGDLFAQDGQGATVGTGCTLANANGFQRKAAVQGGILDAMDCDDGAVPLSLMPVLDDLCKFDGVFLFRQLYEVFVSVRWIDRFPVKRQRRLNDSRSDELCGSTVHMRTGGLA
jgi:hypothetical protein